MGRVALVTGASRGIGRACAVALAAGGNSVGVCFGHDEEGAAETAKADGGPLAGCPFRETRGWIGSVERGHLRINGDVDLMMAGFKPQLTLRSSGGGTTRLDLALVREPNAAVSDHVRLERMGHPPDGRAEIWCGGESIEAFDMVVVR